jgi:predicted RNA-binding protein YlxR (DUF448 family)
VGPSVRERTCVGCRVRSAKRSLLRVVRTVDGTIEIDPSGQAAGRGAYVHPSPACVDRALGHGALGRALRTSIAPDEARKLRGLIERVQGKA